MSYHLVSVGSTGLDRCALSGLRSQPLTPDSFGTPLRGLLTTGRSPHAWNVMDMVLIPEGPFWMGSENRYRWESPRHRVWLDAFEIARTSVTRREYAAFLADTGPAEPAGWRDPFFSDADQPVVGVSWFAALSYCEWVSKSQVETYRLPTEAEWEKACRGGLEGAEYAWGNEPPSAIEYFGGEWKGPRRVGEWRPNGYGLFNIGDNVHEWCSDWYAEDYYASSPERNPAGPENGSRRVSRGGSWRHQIKASRTAHRSSLPPGYAYTDYGFRVARNSGPDRVNRGKMGSDPSHEAGFQQLG